MTKIGKYEIQTELGSGGFGKVYRGFDPLVKRDVAIKVLTYDHDPNLLKRFQAEASLVGSSITRISSGFTISVWRIDLSIL